MSCSSQREKSSWTRLLVLAVAATLVAGASVSAMAQERGRRGGTYQESFEDPLGADLTIDGPGGLNSHISYAENYGGGAPAVAPEDDIDDGWYIDSITITNTTPGETRRRRPLR